MYVCMYVCMYLCVYVRTYICIYVLPTYLPTYSFIHSFVHSTIQPSIHPSSHLGHISIFCCKGWQGRYSSYVLPDHFVVSNIRLKQSEVKADGSLKSKTETRCTSHTGRSIRLIPSLGNNGQAWSTSQGPEHRNVDFSFTWCTLFLLTRPRRPIHCSGVLHSTLQRN
jgi:hypothetical protein